MKRISRVAAALMMVGTLVPLGSGIAIAAEAPSAKTAPYSVSSTQIGTLLDDPAAVAILKRLIPTVYANEMFQQNGRPLTLKDVQQYEPDALSDANLAKIQAELDKLPPKS